MDKISVSDARREDSIGKDVLLQGWVRTRRDSKGGFSFLEVNDGSCQGNVQILAQGTLANYESEVKKLQTENDGLRTAMTDIQANVAVLSDFWFMTDSAFEHKISKSDDDELKKLYATLVKSQKWDDYVELMSYMIKSIDHASNISWLPFQSVDAFAGTGDSR